MERIYFLPQWYLENKANKRLRIMKLIIAAMVVVNLIFLDVLISKLNKVKLLDENIKQKIIIEKDEYLTKNKKKYENNRTLDSFFIFVRSIPPNISFDNIYVENKEINIEISPELFDHKVFINKLEEENKFIIKSLVPPDELDHKNFKANLELR